MSLSIKLFGLSLRLLPSYLHISTSLLRERAGCINNFHSLHDHSDPDQPGFLIAIFNDFVPIFFFFMKRLLSCTERKKRTWLWLWLNLLQFYILIHTFCLLPKKKGRMGGEGNFWEFWPAKRSSAMATTIHEHSAAVFKTWSAKKRFSGIFGYCRDFLFVLVSFIFH